MDGHDLFVKFAEYCQICQHRDLSEEEDPCNECLEHPINFESHKPFCYKARS